ncbi:MAG: hypothetical protein PHE10_09570, partial [Kiritimatiellae bacterium]|nr:hypothetical protein [Kiritimatiellia bacterium]
PAPCASLFHARAFPNYYRNNLTDALQSGVDLHKKSGFEIHTTFPIFSGLSPRFSILCGQCTHQKPWLREKAPAG